MMLTMRKMFPSRALNIAIVGAAILTFAGSFYAMRAQAAVGTRSS